MNDIIIIIIIIIIITTNYKKLIIIIIIIIKNRAYTVYIPLSTSRLNPIGLPSSSVDPHLYLAEKCTVR